MLISYTFYQKIGVNAFICITSIRRKRDKKAGSSALTTLLCLRFRVVSEEAHLPVFFGDFLRCEDGHPGLDTVFVDFQYTPR